MSSCSTSGIGAASQVGAYSKTASNVTPTKKDTQSVDFASLLGLSQDGDKKHKPGLIQPTGQASGQNAGKPASAYAPVNIKV